MITDILKFFLFVLIFIYPLGRLILLFLNLNLSFWQNLLYSMSLGFVIFTYSKFLLSFFNLDPFFWLVIIFPLIYFLLKDKLKPFQVINKKLAVVILITIFCNLSLSFFSGDFTSNGLRIIGGHAHDSLWHLSLIKNLKEKIPPENPIYANTLVQNYHYYTDIFISTIWQITNISIFNLYFKIIPLFFLLVLSGLIYLLIYKITHSSFWGMYGLILTLLTSNLYYISKYLYPNATITPSVFWIDEFVTKMTNLQLTASYILIVFLMLLLIEIKKIDIKFIIIFSILGGSLFGFKSYGSVLFIISIGVLFLLRRDLNSLKLLSGLTLLSIFNYSILPKSIGFIFTFSPFWFIKTMFESSDHLNNSVWELKRQTYLQDKNYLRIIQLYSEGTLVFLLGNLGGKIMGLFTVFLHENNKVYNQIIILMTTIFLVGFLIPMFFIQKGIVWNAIQFSYYSIFFGSILTTIFLSKFNKGKLMGLLIAFFILVSLIPGSLESIFRYLPNSRDIRSKYVIEAAEFLKKQPKGLVIIDPKYNKDALIPLFSEQKIFFADETILSLQLIDHNLRKSQTEDVFTQKTLKNVSTQGSIYIFAQYKSFDVNTTNKIFENGQVSIYTFESGVK